MKIFLKGFFGALFALALTPTLVEAKKAPAMTPMEMQALQSREFETSKENLFGAVMSVVQDLGYQIQSADVQTGFVSAISITEQRTNFFEALGGARSTGQTKMTAFIQNLPNGMARVRLNFLFTRSTSMAYGQSMQNDKPVLDVVVYRNAWDKIDEALFVMGALDAPEAKTSAEVKISNDSGSSSPEKN